ncbi:MAG: hypothetical protein U5N53_12850 [Mycobacterium sp.]|nr:hypothetical protein [Mycobacterium sp.]
MPSHYRRLGAGIGERGRLGADLLGTIATWWSTAVIGVLMGRLAFSRHERLCELGDDRAQATVAVLVFGHLSRCSLRVGRRRQRSPA